LTINGDTVQRYRVGDQVYSILRARILNGILLPGEEIQMEGLSRNLKTSKTPVREALNRLKGEGLVIETRSEGKLRIISLSLDEIVKICELRAVLETLALKWGFDNIPREKLKENLQALGIAKDSLEKGDPEPFREADNILHDLIIRSAGNQWLIQITYHLKTLIDMTKNIFPSQERYRECLHDHILLVESLLNQDKDGATKNLNADIDHMKNCLMVSFQQREQRGIA